jgi:hypothetical protein
LGKITYIDNKSGHYKPAEQDLARAINILINEHSLDMSSTRVIGYRPAGTNLIAKNSDVIGGRQFTMRVAPPPPYPPPY